MSDLEQRVADALAHGAQDAPSAVGLAAAARSRARRRRRTRVGAAAAGVALCIAVPTAVVAARSSDPAKPAPSHVADDGATDGAVPTGQRVESWHDVTLLVPDSWGYGSLEDWCADSGALTPRVQRPGGVSLDIKCETSTYGISFEAIDNHDDFEWPVVQQDPRSGYPEGAYVGGRGIGGVLVMVTAPTQAEGLDILATMRAIGPEGDPNGCTSSRGEAPPTEVPNGVMRICRYDDTGRLEQSEALTGQNTGSAIAALEDAPAVSARDACPRAVTTVEPIVRLRTPQLHANVDLGGDCPTIHGLGPDRELTPEVLYWALSPGWSGSVPEGVSLPSELRTD